MPIFDRIKIAADGTIHADSWAYNLVQEKWIRVAAEGLILPFALADSVFDGSSWAAPVTALTPLVQTEATGPWIYQYGNGDVEYQLNLTASSVAGQETDEDSGIVYPAGAQSVNFVIEQKAGVLYSLTAGTASSSSDDGEQYENAAALRAAHTTASIPLCLTDYDKRALIYFDEATHAAAFAYTTGACNPEIKTSDKIKAVESGVITLDGRTIIALQIPDPLTISQTPVREKQILAIVGLDEDGYAANGLAYLPGYATTIREYFNETAFRVWLNTVTADAEAKILP